MAAARPHRVRWPSSQSRRGFRRCFRWSTAAGRPLAVGPPTACVLGWGVVGVKCGGAVLRDRTARRTGLVVYRSTELIAQVVWAQGFEA